MNSARAFDKYFGGFSNKAPLVERESVLCGLLDESSRVVSIRGRREEGRECGVVRSILEDESRWTIILRGRKNERDRNRNWSDERRKKH